MQKWWTKVHCVIISKVQSLVTQFGFPCCGKFLRTQSGTLIAISCCEQTAEPCLHDRTTSISQNLNTDWLIHSARDCSQYGVFWGKNFKDVFSTPFPIENIIFNFVIRHLVPWKMVMPPKIIFRSYFGKYCWFFFFLKKLLYKKYSKPHFSQKKFTLIFVAEYRSSSKWLCPPTNGFSQFFQHKLIREVFLLESILIPKKI